MDLLPNSDTLALLASNDLLMPFDNALFVFFFCFFFLILHIVLYQYFVRVSIKIINRFGDDRKKNIPNMHRSMEIEAGVVVIYLK